VGIEKKRGYSNPANLSDLIKLSFNSLSSGVNMLRTNVAHMLSRHVCTHTHTLYILVARTGKKSPSARKVLLQEKSFCKKSPSARKVLLQEKYFCKKSPSARKDLLSRKHSQTESLPRRRRNRRTSLTIKYWSHTPTHHLSAFVTEKRKEKDFSDRRQVK